MISNNKKMLLIVVAIMLLLSDFFLPIMALAQMGTSYDEIDSYSDTIESSPNFSVRTSFQGEALNHADLLFISIDVNTMNAENKEIKAGEKLILNFSNPSAVYELMHVITSEGFDAYFDYDYEHETGELTLVFTEDLPENIAFTIVITIRVAGKVTGEGNNESNVTMAFWNLEGEHFSIFVINGYFIVNEIYIVDYRPYNLLTFGGGLQPHLPYPFEDNWIGRKEEYTYFNQEPTLDGGTMYMTWHMVFVLSQEVQYLNGNMAIDAIDGKILEDSISVYVQNKDLTDPIDSRIDVNYISQSEAVVYFSGLNRYDDGDRIVVQFMTEEEDVDVIRQVNVGAFSEHGTPHFMYQSQIGVFKQPAEGQSQPIIILEDIEVENGTEDFDLKQGVTATDFFDGDITSKLIISDDGGFNINQDGSYQVIYSVSNSFGVTTYRTRNITVYSKEKTASVTVRYEDKEGEALLNPTILTGLVGMPYETQPEEIAGWYVVETPSNASGTFSEEAQEVVYVYDRSDAASVTVKYQDTEGNQLSVPTVLSGKVGLPYETQPEEIAGWYVVETPGNASGTFSEDAQEVIYVYDRSDAASVTVKYQDTEGNQLSVPTVLSGKVGLPYETQPEEIAGWYVVETPSNASGTFSEDAQKVVYVYDREIVEAGAEYNEKVKELIDLHLPQNDQDKKILPLLGAKKTIPLFGFSLIGLATLASKLKSKKKLDDE